MEAVKPFIFDHNLPYDGWNDAVLDMLRTIRPTWEIHDIQIGVSLMFGIYIVLLKVLMVYIKNLHHNGLHDMFEALIGIF